MSSSTKQGPKCFKLRWHVNSQKGSKPMKTSFWLYLSTRESCPVYDLKLYSSGMEGSRAKFWTALLLGEDSCLFVMADGWGNGYFLKLLPLPISKMGLQLSKGVFCFYTSPYACCFLSNGCPKIFPSSFSHEVGCCVVELSALFFLVFLVQRFLGICVSFRDLLDGSVL